MISLETQRVNCRTKYNQSGMGEVRGEKGNS